MPIAPDGGLGAALRSRGRVAAAVAWTGATPVWHRVRRALAPPQRRPELYQAFKQRWAEGLLRILGVRTIVAPAPPPPATTGRLVVANHRSALDIPVLYALFGGTILSRGDLAGWPIVGWAAREAGILFVDRDNPHSGMTAIRAIKAALAAGQTVILFAEGTTYAGDEVRPLQHGAFAALRGTDAEVVPVGLAHPPGTEYVEDDFLSHAINVTRRARVRVSVAVGAPLRPTGNAREIAEALRPVLQDLVTQARARIG